MWCTSCGTELAYQARFCSACGNPVGAAATPPPPPRPEGAKRESLGQSWASFMRWRASAIVQPIEDLATARALVVGGALAMAFDAGLTALLGLFVHPVFVIVGLIGCGLAAGIWFANSRAAAIISCIIAILGTLTNLATLDPLAIMRSIVITVFVIGAVRGTFAWHGRQRSAPAPVAANQFA